MAGERLDNFCSAHGCELKPVMADMCLFHSRIGRNLWTAVTSFLKSYPGEQVVDASRKNRMLWAMGVDIENVEYWPPKTDEEKAEFCFNSHDRAMWVLGKLAKHITLPDEIDLNDREKTINQLKCRPGYRVYLDEYKATFSLDWMCETYEQILVDYVEKEAEKAAGVKRDLREEYEKREEALKGLNAIVDKIRYSY